MNDSDLQLIRMCQSSFRLSDGSVYSQRRNMVIAEWKRECEAVAGHLNIPVEQHHGTHTTEYTVKAVEQPHHGLLGRSMIYWLSLDFVPEAGRAMGTLMAAVYLHLSDPEVHQQPVILYLQGYDASYVAWALMEEKDLPLGDGGAEFDAWAKTAQDLLESWRRRLARRLYKAGG